MFLILLDRFIASYFSIWQRYWRLLLNLLWSAQPLLAVISLPRDPHFPKKVHRHCLMQGKIWRVDCISKSWINAADGNFLMDASSQSRRTTIDMLVKTSTVLVLQNHDIPKFKGFSIFLVKVLKFMFLQCNNPPRHSVN